MPQRERIVKLLCILVVTGLVLWVGLHGAIRAREPGRRIVCAKQLMGIATEMQVYVNSGWDGKSPFIEWLLANNPDSQRWVTCPGSGKGMSNYVILPLSEGWPTDRKAVIAYEPKSNHGGEGGNIVFGDGHASFVRVPEFDELVRSAAKANP